MSGGAGSPPRLPAAVLSWILPEVSRAAVLGDLQEVYSDDLERRGRRAANRRYWWDAVASSAAATPAALHRWGQDRRSDYSLILMSCLFLAAGTSSGRRALAVVSLTVGFLAIALWGKSLKGFSARFKRGAELVFALFLANLILDLCRHDVLPTARGLLIGLSAMSGCALALGAAIAVFSTPGWLRFLPIALIPTITNVLDLAGVVRGGALGRLFGVAFPFSTGWGAEEWRGWNFGLDCLFWFLVAVLLALATGVATRWSRPMRPEVL